MRGVLGARSRELTRVRSAQGLQRSPRCWIPTWVLPRIGARQRRLGLEKGQQPRRPPSRSASLGLGSHHGRSEIPRPPHELWRQVPRRSGQRDARRGSLPCRNLASLQAVERSDLRRVSLPQLQHLHECVPHTPTPEVDCLLASGAEDDFDPISLSAPLDSLFSDKFQEILLTRSSNSNVGWAGAEHHCLAPGKTKQTIDKKACQKADKQENAVAGSYTVRSLVFRQSSH